MESRRRKSLTLVAGTIGLCAGWFTYQAALESQIQKEIELAKNSGLPTVASDLAPPSTLATLYPNAAPYYQILYDALLAMDQDAKAKLYAALDPEKRATSAELRAGLATVAELLPEIDRATDIQNCRFRRDYRLGYGVLLPEYATMRQVCRVKLAQARLALNEGNRDEALANLQEAANVARHCGSDRNEISTAVRASVEKDVMGLVRELQPSSSEAMTILASLGDLPNARLDVGSHFVLYQYSANTAASERDWAQVQSDLGLKREDLQSWPVQDWLYRNGVVQRATDLTILRGIRKVADALPTNPRVRSDFAGYTKLREDLLAAWTPMRDVFVVQDMVADYPTSYLALVAHRDELRQF